jgi:hypothetical protein
MLLLQGHGALMLEGLPTPLLTGQKDVSGGGTFCAQLPWGGPYYTTDAQMNILHMSLHGALMLEDSPARMLTGLKDVLLEGPSVLSCHWGGPFYSPLAQMHVLHMSLHGAMMLEGGPPTLMWTGQKNVLVEGPSVLSCHGEGPITGTHLMPRCTSFTCSCMVL